MGGGPVTLVHREPVAGEAPAEPTHDRVACNLRQDRRRGDVQRPGVRTRELKLGRHGRRVLLDERESSVEQTHVRLERQPRVRPPRGELTSADDPAAVDLGRRGAPEPPNGCGGNRFVQGLAPTSRQPLRIVEAGQRRRQLLPVEPGRCSASAEVDVNAGNSDGPGQCSPSRLVESDETDRAVGSPEIGEANAGSCVTRKGTTFDDRLEQRQVEVEELVYAIGHVTA